MSKPLLVPSHNRILSALSEDDYARLSPELESIPLTAGTILQEEGEPMAYVYFPQTGILSLLAHLEDGDSIEIAAVGYEGMVGVSVYLGATTSPNQVLVQVTGTAHRLPARRLRAETSRSGSLRDCIARYTNALLASSGQTIACNRFHHLDARCARWLLATHDRVSSDQFVLTHEFLALMLGVRRAGVTTAAGALQRAGLISYTQGHVTIRNRVGLEHAACECYAVVKGYLEEVFRPALGDAAMVARAR
jgi:CRP-like cAMP-binding protein